MDKWGAESGWIYYNGPVGTGTSVLLNATSYRFGFSHPAPSPFFTYSYPETSGKSPQPGDEIFFNDTGSVCYDNYGVTSCRFLSDCVGGNCYTWNFGDGTPLDHTAAGVSHIYSEAKNYTSSLTICDDIGCCSAVKNIPVETKRGVPSPRWQEITPF